MSITLGVWDGDYVSQLPYVWYYVVVKSRFKHARASTMAYVVSVMLYPCMFCVTLLMDLFVLCVVCLFHPTIHKHCQTCNKQIH